jgi:hypothetical protein
MALVAYADDEEESNSQIDNEQLNLKENPLENGTTFSIVAYAINEEEEEEENHAKTLNVLFFISYSFFVSCY